MSYILNENKILYKVVKGNNVEVNNVKLDEKHFRIELDSDGETDYTYYYKGNELKYVKVYNLDIIEQEEA